MYVNLWHNPRTIYEALDVAERVRACQPAKLEAENISSVHGSEGRKLAEIVSLSPTKGESQWIGMQFAQTWVLRIAVQLEQSILAVPGKTPVEIKLCGLVKLGELGYDQRDTHDAFTMSRTDWSPYPAFWDHNAKSVVSLCQTSNAHLIPRIDAAPGRKLKEATKLAESAGRILLIERARTNTHRVLAVGFDEAMLGNTWWAFKSTLSDAQEKVLLLWLNSTLAILLMLSRRVTTEGVWMKIKKPAWAAVPVLDVRALSNETLVNLASTYDGLCSKELLALAKLDDDPIRAEIDTALSIALNLPDLEPLRQLLGREPGLTGEGLSIKPGQTAMFTEAELNEENVAQLRLI